MQIFLHRLDGSQQALAVDQSTTVSQFLTKNSIQGNNIVCQGSILNFNDHLCSCVTKNANLYVTSGLDGGKRKRKKKVFTTKKKNKHIHKKIKLLALSLYSVDGKGNITQQRKGCPSCGPGTFMGQHWDRYYCGLCHTTIKMDPETVKKNEQIMKKKRAALQAERKAKEKEAADKAPAGKGKKDAKKKKK